MKCFKLLIKRLGEHDSTGITLLYAEDSATVSVTHTNLKYEL